jgi:hypothetical protein
MNVLVSGGRNPECIHEIPVKYVREICTEIGTLLISNGNIIFAGESPGIDTWVTKAAKEKCLKMGLDYRDRIKVYYHGIYPAHENGELIKSCRSDRIVGVPEIVEYSRCGILLSGFTGTQILAKWLKKYSKPIIPIGASGGTSKILFDKILSSEKFSEEELKLLQVISSITRTPKEIANAVLDLMDLFTRSQKITTIPNMIISSKNKLSEEKKFTMKRNWLKALGNATISIAGPFGAPLAFLLSLDEDEKEEKRDSRIEQLLLQPSTIDKKLLEEILDLKKSSKNTYKEVLTLIYSILDTIKPEASASIDKAYKLLDAKEIKFKDKLSLTQKNIIDELCNLFAGDIKLFLVIIDESGFPIKEIESNGPPEVIIHSFISICRGLDRSLLKKVFNHLYERRKGSSVLKRASKLLNESNEAPPNE